MLQEKAAQENKQIQLIRINYKIVGDHHIIIRNYPENNRNIRKHLNIFHNIKNLAEIVFELAK